MALLKITFDGSSVPAKRDADVSHHAESLQKAGILEGLGNEVGISTSNNYIIFGNGYVSVYGRRVYVEEGTSIYVALDSVKYGWIAVEVNLANNEASLKKLESGTGYPSLTQEDLSDGGEVYQLPICKYSKTTSALTIQSYSVPKIPTPQSLVDAKATALKASIDSEYSRWWLGNPGRSGNYYVFNASNVDLADSSLLVQINNALFIPISGQYVRNTSNGGVNYTLYGTSYTLLVEYHGDKTIWLCPGDTSHAITYIYGTR